jgi:hypothetical protein
MEIFVTLSKTMEKPLDLSDPTFSNLPLPSPSLTVQENVFGFFSLSEK